MNRVTALVSAKWLAENLTSKTKNLRVLDASWHLPSTGRIAGDEYKSKHIPGSLFFDIDECSDKDSRFSHMLPTPRVFENYVSNLGVNNNTHVVVYDNNEKFGLFSAARVWWTFRVFGHNSVSILDGGLPKWCSEGHAVTDKESSIDPSESPDSESFQAKFHPDMVRSFEDMQKNLTAPEPQQVVDARVAGRFNGVEPEPRPEIKPGHMLGATNLPFPSILDADSRTVKSPSELEKLFADAGVDLYRPIVATCGSGVTACCITLAAHLCGKTDVSVYDGAWTEWYLRAKAEHKANCPED